jgi:hypothetical protein
MRERERDVGEGKCVLGRGWVSKVDASSPSHVHMPPSKAADGAE